MQYIHFGAQHLYFGNEFGGFGFAGHLFAGAYNEPFGGVFELKTEFADEVVANFLFAVDDLADKTLVDADGIGQRQLAAVLLYYNFKPFYYALVRHNAIIKNALLKAK